MEAADRHVMKSSEHSATARYVALMGNMGRHIQYGVGRFMMHLHNWHYEASSANGAECFQLSTIMAA